MEKIAVDFKDKGVIFYNLYTREPHPGQVTYKRDPKTREYVIDPETGERVKVFDFSDKKQTKTLDEREIYALGMLKDYGQKRPIIIDNFDKDCVQNTLGGRAPNSLIVVDREGKLAYWEQWANPKNLREKLDEMTKK